MEKRYEIPAIDHSSLVSGRRYLGGITTAELQALLRDPLPAPTRALFEQEIKRRQDLGEVQ